MRKHKADLAVIERRQNIAAEKLAKFRAERVAVEAGVAETSALREARGEIIVIPKQSRGERLKPRRVQSGLDWLWSKERLTRAQYDAGLRYGDDWRDASDVTIKSCLAEGGGGDPTTPQEIRRRAQLRLLRANEEALCLNLEMQSVVSAVCGEGKTIRSLCAGDDVLVYKKEAVLLVALDLLAKHYGIACT